MYNEAIINLMDSSPNHALSSPSIHQASDQHTHHLAAFKLIKPRYQTTIEQATLLYRVIFPRITEYMYGI
ncbi:predicted protein [Sclerotinia sclerotiorum 1980 UF-70]|uniref:Uncharacterized protein n=1 Tax=Sclerotinia sclerotiorum (strain ATCC 18683 / 1980 / Ss-1) TaxID=665079 RepID=A7F728_SCLS1|nr:predicted protein [Sclerotinia sclerotiorum 1980 UF-70]EDN98549.1 predicted protein [Sclerotinia sclerotiorum 1980 UF-70]